MRDIDNLIFGDIALAELPYTDGSKTKIRPVLILTRDKNDYLLMKITSITDKKEQLDIEVSGDYENNLEAISVIKVKKISTYSKEILLQKLWVLWDKECGIVRKNLKEFVDNL